MTKLEQTSSSPSVKGTQWQPINEIPMAPFGYSPYTPYPATSPPSSSRHSSSTVGSPTSPTGVSPMKLPVERSSNDGEAKAPKKKSAGNGSKKPEVPPGLEHFHIKYPKPAHSYSFLITTAIMESPQQQMTLNEIYEWVMERYPWYRTAINGWKNSIRHNLSLNKAFMRVPRPPSEPGKGSYWKLDPNQQNPLDQPHNGGSGGNGSGPTRSRNRRSSSSQRSSNSRNNRRATSDPTPHQMPTGSDVPLTPVPVLPKRPGQQDPDPYVIKIDNTNPVQTVIHGLPSTAAAAASRRHSHLLSHDNYATPQEQLQHIEQQHGQYATQMTSSFGLPALNTQNHSQGALFSPTSPTGTGANGDYGSTNSFYSPNGNSELIDSDSSSLSRFQSTGLYFSPNGSAGSRPLSMPGSTPYGTGSHYNEYYHNGQYTNGNSHSYGQVGQTGNSTSFYSNSVGYGLSASGRGSISGGSQGYGSQTYRSFHDYNNPSPDYSGGNHSRSSSMMSISPPTSSFMGASSAPSTSYSINQSFGQAGSGMLSPVSPGGHNSAMSVSSSPPPSTGSMRSTTGPMMVPQDSKGLSNSATNSRSHAGW